MSGCWCSAFNQRRTRRPGWTRGKTEPPPISWTPKLARMLARRVSWTKHRNGPSAHVVPSRPSSKQRQFASVKSGIAPSLRIASDLNIGDAALREWVRLAKIDAGDGPAGALTTEEREELTRLRREYKRVLMDLEILKNATASSTGQCNTFGSTPSKEGGLHGSKRTTRTHGIAEGRVVATVEGRSVAHRHWTRAR